MKQYEITPLFIVSVPFCAAVLALLFTVFLVFKVKGASSGEPDSKQVKISGIIQRGAMSFLKSEYLWLIPFVIAMAIFFIVEEAIQGDQYDDKPGRTGWRLTICFIIGAILSAASGYAGMLVATECNVKTAEAAKVSLNDALKIAFAGGSVMGFTVVGLSLFGLTLLFWLFAFGWETYDLSDQNNMAKNIGYSLEYMAGFSFGASAIALFARVAGGIYTKAADVGADLVGKVEADFPEDSFYNPATIADNVGDNVGDVAGMGADLFESFVGSVVAAATLAMTAGPTNTLCPAAAAAAAAANVTIAAPVGSTGSVAIKGTYDLRRVALPFWVAGFGVLASMIGFFAVGTSYTMENKDESKMNEEEKKAYKEEREKLQNALLSALHRGIYLSGVLILGFSALCVALLFQGDESGNTSDTGLFYNDCGYKNTEGWKAYGCIIIGLVCGILIGEATEYFTSYGHRPTKSITESGTTGEATVIIQGLGIGMLSSVPPVVFVAASIMACAALDGVYGAALAAVGMLSTLGITLATDAYGPVADNAGGVAEMSHLLPEVREKTDALDALGNTTAATGKGFAVGSAVLTALAFMNAFADKCILAIRKNDTTFNPTDFFSLTDPLVLSGLLIGAMLPFLFAALTMLSVGKAAQGIIKEVRRQLEKPELKEMKYLCQQSENEHWDIKDLNTYRRYPSENKNGDGETQEAYIESIRQDKDKGDGKTKEEMVKRFDEVQPDYDECILICTKDSLKEMLLPGALAILTPLGVGLLVGAKCLGGLLMGAIGSGFLLAVMMNNAGGAWDNSKKYVENEGPLIKTKDNYWEVVKKKHRIHKAVVTGDTVGDPFKDTSGPALNILIKLMSVLSLTCAGLFRDDWETYWVGIIVFFLEIVVVGVIFFFVWGAGGSEEPDEKNGDTIIREPIEVQMEGTGNGGTELETLKAELELWKQGKMQNKVMGC
jgi:H(+)-translocating pyrophosphatase